MYQQQALCPLPADVLEKVIVVVDKVSEDNSYCTPKEDVIDLLSKVRIGDPTLCELLRLFGSVFGKMGD